MCIEVKDKGDSVRDLKKKKSPAVKYTKKLTFCQYREFHHSWTKKDMCSFPLSSFKNRNFYYNYPALLQHYEETHTSYSHLLVPWGAPSDLRKRAIHHAKILGLELDET